MDTEQTMQLVTAPTAATHGSIQTILLKKTHEMEMNLISMLTENTLAPPPPGQGLKVDKQA